MRVVGALLDAKQVHPNRTARAHLRWIAATNRLKASRVDEVLDMVGLSGSESTAAGKKAGTLSLGMSQRLGIAAALLGDPPVLLFDEPVNGLDPEGIRCVRTLMRTLAGRGPAQHRRDDALAYFAAVLFLAAIVWSTAATPDRVPPQPRLPRTH
jgi:ABC-2 type transport system ATP-binding protein